MQRLQRTLLLQQRLLQLRLWSDKDTVDMSRGYRGSEWSRNYTAVVSSAEPLLFCSRLLQPAVTGVSRCAQFQRRAMHSQLAKRGDCGK